MVSTNGKGGAVLRRDGVGDPNDAREHEREDHHEEEPVEEEDLGCH